MDSPQGIIHLKVEREKFLRKLKLLDLVLNQVRSRGRGSGVQGQACLYKKLEASLDYKNCCLKISAKRKKKKNFEIIGNLLKSHWIHRHKECAVS